MGTCFAFFGHSFLFQEAQGEGVYLDDTGQIVQNAVNQGYFARAADAIDKKLRHMLDVFALGPTCNLNSGVW